MSQKPPPIINAPPVVVILAGLFVVVHLIVSQTGGAFEIWAITEGAVYPQRFWPWTGLATDVAGVAPYSNVFEALLPTLTTALLHGDWGHVLMNSAMLLGVGKPVHEVIKRFTPPDRASRYSADVRFLVLFVASVVGGSLLHLVSHYPYGPIAIGASGGVSGVLAAVLLTRTGAAGMILSADFLKVSAAFLVGNVVLALVGPGLLGVSIAWQAHIGGYVAGAIGMKWMLHAGARYFE